MKGNMNPSNNQQETCNELNDCSIAITEIDPYDMVWERCVEYSQMLNENSMGIL